ncbi:MAG: SpoVR family protein [Proteobacteria bacterium]|nr:SpoVR family protein [Pseudomonadota bacterium]
MQHEVEQVARECGLKLFDQVFELLDYQTMSEVAAYGGFPTRYPHWRYGMEYERLSKSHAYGLSTIYELVINNDPCYAYLLEGNSYVEQKLVMAHVCGHNDFFRNNYYFSRTNRKMIDEMANHATRVRRLMERLGVDRVESFIDVCLSVDNLIDPMSLYIERARHGPSDGDGARGEARATALRLPVKASYMERYINPPELFAAAAEQAAAEERSEAERAPRLPARPDRDVLQFLVEHAPLESWQSDVLEMVREEAYYFAPQAMTKIMNEGWASYWHSRIMTERILTDAEVIDYAEINAGVLAGGFPFNPYKLGVELLRHIEERWNMGRFGKEWEECDDLAEKKRWDRQLGQGRQRIFEVRALYNDVMFIDEFFTEDFCREQLFYAFGWNERSSQWELQSRQFQQIKAKLLAMLTHQGQPLIEVEDGNFENRGELLLRHRHEGVDLRLDWARDTLGNLNRLWRRPVNLATRLEDQPKLLRFDGREHSERSWDGQ